MEILVNVDPFVRATKPEPAWWDEPDLRDALSQRDIGQVFYLLNRRHGLSQRRIAELAGFAASEIYEIIKGRKVMAYDVLVRIADGLGVPRGYMGLASTTAPLASTQVQPTPTSLDDPHERQEFVTALAGFAVGGTPPRFEQWLPRTDEWPSPSPETVTPAPSATPAPPSPTPAGRPDGRAPTRAAGPLLGRRRPRVRPMGQARALLPSTTGRRAGRT